MKQNTGLSFMGFEVPRTGINLL